MKNQTKQQILFAIVIFTLFYILASSTVKEQDLTPTQTDTTTIDTTIMDISKAPVDSSKFYRDSIQIIKKYTSDPNSAGGVDLNIIWKNKSKRTIKYASFEVSAINSVNDEVYSEISVYDGVKYVKVTGPIKPNQINGYGTYWECVWYNSTIQKCKIRSVELEYMDGSKIEFTL